MDLGGGGKSTIPQKFFTVRKVFCYSWYGNCGRSQIEHGLNYVGAYYAAVKSLRGRDYGAKSLGQSSR